MLELPNCTFHVPPDSCWCTCQITSGSFEWFFRKCNFYPRVFCMDWGPTADPEKQENAGLILSMRPGSAGAMHCHWWRARAQLPVWPAPWEHVAWGLALKFCLDVQMRFCRCWCCEGRFRPAFFGQRWLNKCIRNIFLLPLNMINISGSCSEGLVNVSCRFSSSSNREVLLLSATLPLSHSCLRPRHVRSYGRRYSAKGHWFRTQREMVSKGSPPPCFWG